LISGNNTVCLGDNTILTASGGGNYSWNTGQISSSISVVPSAATNYSVFVSVGSCKDTAAYSVAVVPNPTATAASNVTISQGQSTTLTATGGGTYSWSSGGATATISVTPLVTTTYCVFVTDANGCSDSACVKVTVTPMECLEEVYVPNAFSPNGDGENDLFRVYFVNIACVKKFSMEIYDRWGEKVFQSAEPVFFWGGEHNGTVMNSAVFVYYMYVQFVSGQEVNKKGNVSLVR
jgi:gliding motility-associated-like protein